MSLTKAEIKALQSLQSKKGRDEQDRFFVSGVRLLEEAIRHRNLPEQIYFAEHLLSARAQSLVERFRTAGVKSSALSSPDLNKISDTVTSQGVAGVFKRTMQPASTTDVELPHTTLLCENLRDPGNLGTLLRSALAFGVGLVLLTGHSTDAYAPKVVRSSAGAIFGLTILESPIDSVRALKESSGVRVIAADKSGSLLRPGFFRDLASESVVLAIGSEADGLSGELIAAADAVVRIPHAITVESLNAAIAGSILLHARHVEVA